MLINVACLFDINGLDNFSKTTADDTDILILPELSDGGYARLYRDGGPSADVDKLINSFAQLSNANNVTVVAGTLALRDDDGRLENASLIFANGQPIARYPKVHLFRPLKDDEYFTAGTPGNVTMVKWHGQTVRLGVIVCYDLRFPELVRPWFKSGLDLLIIPARWPRVRDEIWRTLLCARAIENQCFVVGVNARDDEGGGSYAFAPGGDEIFALGPKPHPDDPPWCSLTLDLDDIARVKARLDTHTDARLL